ncbi:MAG: flagellar hook-associated protein FlgL [Puniceicoccaceae bacterium]
MRIPYNGYSEMLMNQLTRLNSDQVKIQQQLSSGQRIQEAHEDPSAVGRALSTSTEKARIQTQSRNLNRAQLIGEFSSDTLEQMKVLVDKARVDANNTDGLTSSEDFRARALQTNQLIEQSLRVANAKVAGDYLFAGANTGEQPFVAVRYEAGDVLVDANGDAIQRVSRDANGDPIIDGATGGYVYENITVSQEMVGMVAYIQYTGTTTNTSPDPPATTADDISFRVGEGATISPFSAGTKNEEYLDFFNDMVGLRDAYFQERLQEDEDLDPAVSAIVPNTHPAGTIEGLVTNFDDHQQNVLLGIVEFGSLLQGIEVTTKINESRFNELEYLSSQELDVDIAEAIVQLNRIQTTYEAALSTGSRIMGLSLLDFIQ